MAWRENGLIKDRWHERWKPFVMDAGRHFRQCHNLRDIRYVFHTKHYLLWWCSSWLFKHVDDYKWAQTPLSVLWLWCIDLHLLECTFSFLFKWWRTRNVSSSCHIFFYSCVKWYHESLQDLLTKFRTFDQSMSCFHLLNMKAYIVIRSPRRKQRSGSDVSLWHYMRHMHDFCTDITYISLSLHTRWMKLHMKERTYMLVRD